MGCAISTDRFPSYTKKRVLICFLWFGEWHMYLWHIHFAVQTHRPPSYVVAQVGAVSNICDIFLFPIFSILVNDLTFIEDLWNNFLAKNYMNSVEVSYILSKYFISIYISTSVQAMKTANTQIGRQVFIMHSQNQLETLSHHNASMHCDFALPPLSAMTRNNYRIFELEYLPILHPSSLI